MDGRGKKRKVPKKRAASGTRHTHMYMIYHMYIYNMYTLYVMYIICIGTMLPVKKQGGRHTAWAGALAISMAAMGEVWVGGVTYT